MNYNDYYARQAGGALPYFVSARYQRGHGLGSLFSGLVRSAMPLIKRGAVAVRKGASKTGGVSPTTSCPTRAGKNLLSGLLTPSVRPCKHIKRAPAKKRVTTVRRQRKKQTTTTKKSELDILDDSFRAYTAVRAGSLCRALIYFAVSLLCYFALLLPCLVFVVSLFRCFSYFRCLVASV